MDNKKSMDINDNDFEYTIVLDSSSINFSEPADTEKQNSVSDAETSELKERMDRLYYDYERMFLREPTTLDKDDIYPHSYPWRLGDKYDPGKEIVLREAISKGKRIVNTEAFALYEEEVKSRKFAPVSWE